MAEIKICSTQSPRALPNQTLQWFEGDTFTWTLRIELKTDDMSLIYDDIASNTIVFNFYKENGQILISKTLLVSELEEMINIENGIINITISFDIKDGAAAENQLDTNSFTIGNYYYNSIYVQNNIKTTIIHKKWIKVE